MAIYQSDITRFLQELKQDRPHLEQEQRKGRAIWWDRPQDLDTSRRNLESRVAQQPYVYQTRG
jgi:hypothetical protein